MDEWESSSEDDGFDFDVSTISRSNDLFFPSLVASTDNDLVQLSSDPLSHDHHVTTESFTKFDSDDGWISDENEAKDEGDTYLSLDNEVMIEDMRRVWLDSEKERSPELVKLIHSLLEEHSDPYSLVLCVIEKSGKTRPQPNSINRIVLSEFQKWNELSRGGVPTCSPWQQAKAIQILEFCHHVLFDDIAKIFLLGHAPKEKLVAMVMSLLDCYRHSDAINYIVKLKLQNEFNVTEMLLPVIALDKINLIENYLEGYPKLQIEFLKYLEKLCMSPEELEKAKKHLIKTGIKYKCTNSKLSSYQLEKLILRLTNMFGLSISNYPKLFERKAVSSINYMLQKKYIDDMLHDDDVLEAAVKDKPLLQYHLVIELTSYNDLPSAAYYVQKYDIPKDTLPLSVIEYINSNPHCKPVTAAKSNVVQRYYNLKLPLHKVVFVSDEKSFNKCYKKLTKVGNVVGIDAEWRLPVCNDGNERLAILQLSVKDAVFIIDTVNLPDRINHELLGSFITELFGSKDILKLGFQVKGDLQLLARSWPFASSVLKCPQRVVDLKYLGEKIFERESKVFNSSNPLGRISYVPSPGSPREYVTNKGRGTNPLAKCSTNDTSSVRPHYSGLSYLVMRCLGNPLDKSLQFSDWERRPLTSQQIHYAALDAHCLLQVYDCLKGFANLWYPDCNLEPTLQYIEEQSKLERRNRKKEKTRTVKESIQS